MSNYKIDGWQHRHWRNVRKSSKDLSRCAADLDISVISGEDTLKPVDVLAFARKLETISKRLRALLDDY